MARATRADRADGEPGRRPGRIDSLDGVRGLAALVVVVHHSLLASWPELANGYFGQPPRRWSAAWWLFETPLHFFWAGPEAVVVFFVLSGFVLALPAVRRGGRWFELAYYPKRLVRLYVPVWGALAVAAALREVQPRVRPPATSAWLQAHAVPMTVHAGLVQASLRDTGTWAFDPVLWSLHWEVLYSVMLPVALVPALLTRRRPLTALGLGAAAGCLTGLGAAEGSGRLTYLPMFVVGALLAFHWQSLCRSLEGLAWASVASLAALATCLVTATYWLRPDWVSGAGADWIAGTARAATLAGASLLVLLALARPAMFETRPMRWLGSRSYSLYLVHEPIVVTLAFATGGRTPVLLFLAAVLPPALVAAELFWRAVENPSIKAAHAAERATRSLLRREARVGSSGPGLVMADEPAQ